MPICTNIHLFSHRYARGKKTETNKDLLTYHSACLLEWDHGQFCTLVELATLNGVGESRTTLAHMALGLVAVELLATCPHPLTLSPSHPLTLSLRGKERKVKLDA